MGRSTWTTLAMCVSLATVSAGCSEDEDEGGGSFSSGVESDKKIEALTDEERQSFCASMDAEMSSVFTKEKACTMMAVFFTPSPTECRSSVTECVKSDFEGERDECPLQTGSSAGCTATVGELEACAGASLAATRRLARGLTCNLAGDRDGLQRLMSGNSTPAACEKIARKCPDLLPADDDDDD